MPVSRKPRKKTKVVKATSRPEVTREKVLEQIEVIRQKLIEIYQLLAYYTKLKEAGTVPEDQLELFSEKIHTIGQEFNTYATSLAKFKKEVEALEIGSDCYHLREVLSEYLVRMSAFLVPMAECTDIILKVEGKKDVN
ncbi:hypothetical protein CPT_Moabite_097 [Serratia phage Moabite]|uniref:Uncharacterized protein n=1 Tax=Serratia phage Moabite TaxID=2587814 RepID=A0A4Y5TP27_9CAUD|nr:hypothetical protein HWC48_gp319 [Serratia phage Moabite]QDB71127.1 hypothetical protein CPT_Moabite_097 [Serratia phage Moabite]